MAYDDTVDTGLPARPPNQTYLQFPYTGATRAPRLSWGTGTPEGAVVGRVGDLFLRTDGGASTTLYVKESGADTATGWVAK